MRVALLAACVLLAGLVPATYLALQAAPDPPGLAPSGLGGRTVEGQVLLPTSAAGVNLAGCIPDGAAGAVIAPVTPGLPFALRATGPAAQEQDFDLTFVRSVNCLAQDMAFLGDQFYNHGDEAGLVPPDATAAIVWLSAGAAGTFRYAEFPPLPPPGPAPPVVNTLHFRVSIPHALSVWNDMYEPHLAIAGTGTIYVAGHTSAADTLHSPVWLSRDDGATWSPAPDIAPVQRSLSPVPSLAGRLGQGNEGGITADDTGRAWLYDAAWVQGTAPLYSWCDDGARSCGFEPFALDERQLLTTACGSHALPRFPDKPWARYGHGQVLLANVGLRGVGVDEFEAASMVGRYDPATGATVWDTCVATGGMPGVPGVRDRDGMIAVPQVLRTPAGQGHMVVHLGPDPRALRPSPPLFESPTSFNPCAGFNGYGTFDAPGNLYVLSFQGPQRLAVTGSSDLAAFATTVFPVEGGIVRFLWAEGSPRGEGALLTWAVGPSCDNFEPVTFYAAHVRLVDGAPVVSEASVIDAGILGVCGDYMGNEVGPDGRAYQAVHASVGACLDTPDHLPLTDAPWRVYIQDGGPRL